MRGFYHWLKEVRRTCEGVGIVGGKRSSSSTVNDVGTNRVNVVDENINIDLSFNLNMPALEDVSTFDFSSDDEDDGAVADMNNLDTTIQIEEEVYVCQPPGFKDPNFPDRVYKVEKALYGLHQAPIAWFTEVKTARAPIETQKPRLKDKDGEEVDVHMYSSMIGSLMYLTSSRPGTMFAVCAFARYQVNPKDSYLYVVKRIFRYLKGQPKLSLWYPKDSPFDLVAYTDSDYAGASMDRKFTIGDEAIHKELGDSLVRAATTTSSLEAKQDSESLGEDASKQGMRIDAINADEDITLVNDADNEMFDVNVLDGEDVFVKGQNENVVEEVVNAAQVSIIATTITITIEEISLAQALEALKTLKPKDKGKGIMIEEPVKSKKKDQIRLDEEAALKLQAKFDKEERLAREKVEREQEANIALIETWDDIQAKKRRKYFAAKRAEEKRNKPPIQAQQRKIMCTYLKNMEEYKLKDLKLKEFDSIQEMFDKAFKRVNTFEEFRTELVEGKEKRAGSKLEQEITKKLKVEDDKEKAELKQLMETILDEEEVAIDAILLAVKSPRIFVHMYMLVEKKYPLTPPTLSMMLEKKLQIDYESKMAYHLSEVSAAFEL
nr:hypothetical protein [Tanacetum cinerariifolium]